MNPTLKPANFLKWIFLLCCFHSALPLFAQITYQHYFELETSDEKPYKTIDLDGQGVLIIALSMDEALNQTKANYKILDNELNERFALDATYNDSLNFNSVHVDSAWVDILYTNNRGNCVFEKIDLGKGTNSQINVDLNKKGEIQKVDFSNDMPFMIRSHEKSQFSIIRFDLKTGEYLTEIIDLIDLTKLDTSLASILDCKIDDTGEKISIVFELKKEEDQNIYDRLDREGCVYLSEVNFENGTSERNKIKYQNDVHNAALIGCGFDQEDLVILSYVSPTFNSKYRWISYQRYSDTTLTVQKKHSKTDFTNYNQTRSKLQLNPNYYQLKKLYDDMPIMDEGSLYFRSNGNCLFNGALFFNPYVFKLPPGHKEGLLYLMFISFDKEGNLLWDQQIQIKKTEELKNYDDNSYNLLYSSGDLSDFTGALNHQNGKLTFYEMNANGTVFVRHKEEHILKYFPRDRIKASSSKLIYMYGRTFLHFGVKRIKNKERAISPFKYMFFAGTIKL